MLSPLFTSRVATSINTYRKYRNIKTILQIPQANEKEICKRHITTYTISLLYEATQTRLTIGPVSTVEAHVEFGLYIFSARLTMFGCAITKGNPSVSFTLMSNA